jgi:uncharacterized membrane protein YqgA involved in biofilm formation
MIEKSDQIINDAQMIVKTIINHLEEKECRHNLKEILEEVFQKEWILIVVKVCGRPNTNKSKLALAFTTLVGSKVLTIRKYVDTDGNKLSSSSHIEQDSFKVNYIDASDHMLAELLKRVIRIEQKIDTILK